MRWPIHDGREPTAVKARSMATALHAFNDKDVFGKHLFPLLGIALAQSGVSVGPCVVDMDIFTGLGLSLRVQQDHKGMVSMHPEQHIGVDGDILCRLVPFIAQPVKISKHRAVTDFELAIDPGALTGKRVGLFDMVVILQPGVAVQPRVDPG